LYVLITAKYTWRVHKTNDDILNELKATSVLDKIMSYETIQHVNRLPRSRLPNLLKMYAPRGRRNQGRPLKRLQDK
jgi:hypothetical protein